MDHRRGEPLPNIRFLNGFFGVHADQAHMIVTGSSRMDMHSSSGDLSS